MYPGLGLFLVAVGLILIFVPHGDDRILRTVAVIALVAGVLVLLATVTAGVNRMMRRTGEPIAKWRPSCRSTAPGAILIPSEVTHG